MNEWDGENRRQRERWKFNKDVSIADLLSFVSAAIAVIYAYNTLDKRVAVLEEYRTEQKEATQAKEADNVRYQTRIDESLHTINDKLDRLAAAVARR